MKTISKLACFAVLSLIPFTARAQDKVNFNYQWQITDRSLHATLDDLAGSMLDDPYVLTEIKVTKGQWTQHQVQQVTQGVFIMMLATQASDEQISDEDKEAVTQAVKDYGFSKTQSLEFSSLSAEQRGKARRIAIRDRTAEALLTKEVLFALRVTPAQQKRLETIRTDYWNRCGKIEGKNMDAAQILKKFKGFSDVNPDEQTAKQRIQLVRKMFDYMVTESARIAAKIDAPITRATKDANARALRVLTHAQVTQLRRLQG